MASTLAKRMRATAEDLVMGFNGDWTKDMAAAVTAMRAPNCMHTVLPASMGMPSKTNEEWIAYFSNLDGFVTDCKMRVHDVIVAAEERKVVVRSSQTSTTTVGPFANEYIWVFTFDDRGEKITEVVEMMDSAAAKEILTKKAQAGAQ